MSRARLVAVHEKSTLIFAQYNGSKQSENYRSSTVSVDEQTLENHV
jgi:hypothetical protein